MQFLSEDTDIVILKLIRSCRRLRWAVAWASHGFDLYHALKIHEDKIDQITVGVHFYQTHPEFIQSFMDHERVRFKMNPAGVFHPKVYLFEHEDDEWDCIVGSANFTRAAYSLNQEACVHFSHRDIGGPEMIMQLRSMLDKSFTDAIKVDADYLSRYQSIWQRQQRRLDRVSGTYADPQTQQPSRSPLETELCKMTWQEFFDWVKIDKNHSAEGRLNVLEEAHRLFESNDHFSGLDYPSRQGIAGFSTKSNLDWKWFGSMQGAGTFKGLIKDNDPAISLALDAIPLRGPVTQEHFENYLNVIRPVLGENPLATATRLLALKRPDYFVCLDSKNLESFRKDFGIKGKVLLTEYWDRVVQRIIDSNWWNAPPPSSGLEQRIWQCRTAFLDVPWYDTDSIASL